jgi:Flp pilus assembly protein TadG
MIKPLQLFRRQDGMALIETALILPVLVLMLLSVADFAVLLNQYLRVADSARATAQAATVRAYATDTSVLSLIGVNSAGGIPGYSLAITNYCTCANGTPTVSCSSHANCQSYGIPNQYVQVTAKATLPLLFGVKGFPATFSVQSTAIARTAWTGTN